MLTTELINACAQNNRKAQRQLYEYCYPVLIKIGKRFAKNEDEAVEIVTESFLKINKSILTISLTENVVAWIKKIGVNTAIDLYRNNKKYNETIKLNAEYIYDKLDNESTDENNIVDGNMEAEYIFILLRELPPTTKEVLNLYAIDGYSHKEIANLLDIKEELSRWHLHKARKIMTEKLKTYHTNQNNILQK